MSEQSVYLVGCSASNFVGAAYHLTPLNTVQRRILALMEVPLGIYAGLVT